MLVQMNQAPLPHPQHFGGGAAGDFKPSAPYGGHHHHSSNASGHHGLLEPHHDEFTDADAVHPHQYASHHHHHPFSSQSVSSHPWTATYAGFEHQQHHSSGHSNGHIKDEDRDDHADDRDVDGGDHEDDEDLDDEDNQYDDNEEPTTPTTPKQRKNSSGKKEIFVCPEVHCGKTFPRSFALRRHMRIHTGTKPYACDFEGCTQRFNTSGNLSRHKRIHSGERPYPCVFASCGKRFNTSTKLKRHMRIHFPDGQSLFHCVQHACVFACDNYKEYVHHQRQHGNPAYAAPPKPQDENIDRSNLPSQPAGGKSRKTTKAKRTPQPRVSKASNAAALATTAALRGDFIGGPNPNELMDRRSAFDHSPSTSAASGLSMLMKEAHRENDLDAVYALDHRRPPIKPHPMDMDRAPRLPFPTGAFPSESISSASPMNLSSAFGSSFRGSSSSSSYYDHSSVSTSAGGYGSTSTSSHSFPSYLRGPPSDGYGHQHSSSYHDSMHFPPLRPEEADEEYDSPSPRSNQQDDDDAKYGGYSNGGHPVGSDFTGEELSAVLELMKDS